MFSDADLRGITPMWSLVTLGSLRLVEVRTGEECLRGRRKELLLLTFLARRAPRPVPRAVLAELLWGDKDEERARASLRQALSRLRHTLGDALEVRNESVLLSADAVLIDVRKIEEGAAAGNWNEIITHWTGSFLAGYDDGGEAYREWVDGERARFIRIVGRAFDAAIADAEHCGAVHDAVSLSRRWLDAFPDDDEPRAALTRALDALKAARRVSHPLQTPAMPEGPNRIDVAPIVPSPGPAPDRRRLLAYAGALVAALAVGAPAARQSFKRGGVESNAATQVVIVPDFRAVGVDSLLAQVVTEALRIDLRQSSAFSEYPPAAVRQAIRQLDLDGNSSTDVETIRRIAARVGVKAIISGEIVGSGDRYLVSIGLVATASGAKLTEYSAVAGNRNELLRTVDILVAELRKGAGEPLRELEEARPVERVTTMSLDALSKYVRATRALDLEGAPAKGIALLEEAIVLDSTFAMAHRRLAFALYDRGGNDARVRALAERAYAFRERLGDRERYVVEAAYHSLGPVPNENKAIAAYEAALEVDPRFGVPLVNLTGIALRRHQFARAESLSKRVVSLAIATIQGHINLLHAQINLGMLDSAEVTIARFDSASAGTPSVSFARASLLYARGFHDSADVMFRRLFEGSTDIVRRETVAGVVRDIALARGNTADGRRWAQIWTEAALQRNLPAAALSGALDQAWITLWFDHDTSAALREVARALMQHPLQAIPPLDRPYDKLIRLFSWADRPSRARVALAGYDSARGSHLRVGARALRARYRGEIALAERKYDDAAAYFRAGDSTSCATCVIPLLAIAADRLGARDSARALWKRYLETPDYDRFESDARFLQLALQTRAVRE
jgi:DNA-binding SARP family transcriptional activator